MNKPESYAEFLVVTVSAFIGVAAGLLAVAALGWVVMVIVNAVITAGSPAYGAATFLALVVAFILALNSYQ